MTELICPRCGEPEIMSLQAKQLEVFNSSLNTVYCRNCAIVMKNGFTGGFERAEQLAKEGDWSGFEFLPKEVEDQFKNIRDCERRLKDASINIWLSHRIRGNKNGGQ